MKINTISYNQQIIQEDINSIIQEKYKWNELTNKAILITGANGMLATYLVYVLFHLNKKYNYQIKILALVRNQKRAEELFANFISDKNFELINQDVSSDINYIGDIDYIIHAAGSASPYSIVHEPVEVVKANILGTFNVLELARKKNVKKVLFTSTREVYGKLDNILHINENDYGTIDPLDERSCYPESKRMAETILKSYELQYGTNFNTLRIAHTYGPGMKLEQDGRIMADLISYIIHNRDIVLKSTGEAIRAFCYITDAVKALFLVLLEGEKGQPYNIANETEPVSIKKLAEIMVNLFPEKEINLKYDIPETNRGYTQYERVTLNTLRLVEMGWKPTVSLKEGIKRTVNSFKI